MANTESNYIGAIDEGTSSSRFLLFEAGTGNLICQSQEEVESKYPHEGWCEQDPLEILSKTISCMKNVADRTLSLGIKKEQIKAIGITNQRETTVVWDRNTGKPLCNAIVWLDNRTASTVEQLIRKTPNNNKYFLQQKCGLPITTYFSAVKLRWILDNNAEVRKAVEERRCLFGTVDSWLVWNLTGGVHGGQHVTDVTNASRTMLMNLETLDWDSELCSFFGIEPDILPKIKSSSEIYGSIKEGALEGIAIAGILGDQQAALVGQGCLVKGSAKNTYGTGNFLLYNTGPEKFFSDHGMLTTVAYKLGVDQPPVFALEGSVAITGAAIKWLRDNLGLIKSAAESEQMAAEVSDSGGVFFVPAFSGLYAPYWRPDARGLIIGLTQFTNRAHLVRATLEAVCFQSAEILEAMNEDSGIPIEILKVDGGMTVNSTLMQMQADILGIPVICPKMPETTALGAAMAAGIAKGIDVWKFDNSSSTVAESKTFSPNITSETRSKMYGRWKEAVQRTMDWEKSHQ